MEFAINTAYMVEKFDKSQSKIDKKNTLTDKTYQQHPSFEPRQYFDNIVKVVFALDSKNKPRDISDIATLSGDQIQSIQNAMNIEHTRLGITDRFNLKQNVTFKALLTGSFEPKVLETVDTETGEETYSLAVQYKFQVPRKPIGISIGSPKAAK